MMVHTRLVTKREKAIAKILRKYTIKGQVMFVQRALDIPQLVEREIETEERKL